jgi:hypothetical protein
LRAPVTSTGVASTNEAGGIDAPIVTDARNGRHSRSEIPLNFHGFHARKHPNSRII